MWVQDMGRGKGGENANDICRSDKVGLSAKGNFFGTSGGFQPRRLTQILGLGINRKASFKFSGP